MFTTKSLICKKKVQNAEHIGLVLFKKLFSTKYRQNQYR